MISNFGFNDSLFRFFSCQYGIGIHLRCYRDGHAIVIAKGTTGGLFALGSNLEVAFGTEQCLTAFGDIDFFVLEKTNGTFSVGGRTAIFATTQSSGNFAVSNQATDSAIFPRTRRIKTREKRVIR